MKQLGQTRHAKNQSHPLVEPQAADAGIPAATNAREMKEGPVAKMLRLSPQLEDHPKNRKWLGSPPFISHKEE